MHSVNISAIFLATTAVAAAGRTFFSVPVGLDKGAVSEAFSSRGIQGFDPSARPNADGLYTANNNNNNNNNNEHRASEEHVDKPDRMEPQQYRIETMAEQPMLPYHPQQHEELEQQQPIMFHPIAALETFADAPSFLPQSAPRPASIIAPPNIAAMSGPPPGRPVAVPLAPAREPRPGLLVAPPVIVNPNVQMPPAIRPNPPTMPPQPPQPQLPPPPQMMPAQPAVTAAAIPPPQMPAPVVSAAPAAETTVIQNNAILTSTVLVMATAPRPPPQPMAASSVQPMFVGKSDAMQGIREEDEFEDEGGDMAAKPTALSIAPQQQQPQPQPQPQQQQPPPVAQSQLAMSSVSIAATPSEQSARSVSLESASKPTGPVKLKPLMFAKANMSVFKPEDIDKFTFPSAELSVNMAGLGRDSSANLPHVASATGFAGSMPNNEHAKPTASINNKAGASAAKATGGAAPDIAGAAPDIVGVASISKPRQQQNSQESELPASSAAAPRGDSESSAVSALQQEFLGAAMLMAVVIHIAVAMF
ncbi:hypothetical protein GGI19_000212 [Coemansia pectinata]|uniref:Uncharacterized protein n=1 Tax=Coemansia pectinata TaxID=1052879 RepID=A0A9W8H4J7_9FUNG|nr:hypothetical protein GGI19_000212 [Coemansia pectinata]